MERTTYRVLYRASVRGAMTKGIGVPTMDDPVAEQALAERIARRWCDMEPNRRFVSVEPEVVADERILGDEYQPPAKVTRTAAKAPAA